MISTTWDFPTITAPSFRSHQLVINWEELESFNPHPGPNLHPNHQNLPTLTSHIHCSQSLVHLPSKVTLTSRSFSLSLSLCIPLSSLEQHLSSPTVILPAITSAWGSVYSSLCRTSHNDANKILQQRPTPPPPPHLLPIIACLSLPHVRVLQHSDRVSRFYNQTSIHRPFREQSHKATDSRPSYVKTHWQDICKVPKCLTATCQAVA